MPLLPIHCSQTLQCIYWKLCFFCRLIGQIFLQVVWHSWSLRFHNVQRRRHHLTEFFWFCWLIWHHMLQIIGSRSEIWHNWISLNNRTSPNKSRVSLLADRDTMRFYIQLKGVLRVHAVASYEGTVFVSQISTVVSIHHFHILPCQLVHSSSSLAPPN
jgi:hypothetical protein